MGSRIPTYYWRYTNTGTTTTRHTVINIRYILYIYGIRTRTFWKVQNEQFQAETWWERANHQLGKKYIEHTLYIIRYRNLLRRTLQPISTFSSKHPRGNKCTRVLRTHITDGDASEQGHLEHSLKFHRVSEFPKTNMTMEHPPSSIAEYPPRKLTWQWKIATLNRGYIFKWMCFHCHVSFQ